VVSTNILFLLGAGLFSKAIGDFLIYVYNTGVGGDVGETGSGPGSFDPTYGTVWHLTYGNPEDNTSTDGYSIFNGSSICLFLPSFADFLSSYSDSWMDEQRQPRNDPLLRSLLDRRHHWPRRHEVEGGEDDLPRLEE
jgi:hypothetical protein